MWQIWSVMFWAFTFDWHCFCVADEAEAESSEGDEREIVNYSITSEVKFFNTKVNR